MRRRTKDYRITRSPDYADRSAGFTFIELLVVTTILLILASAVMPLAKVTMQRQREAELRRSLREMRTAIDKYKDAVDTGLIGGIDVQAGSEGYPPDLETLVEGVRPANDATRAQAEVPAAHPDRPDDETRPSGACARTRTSRTPPRGAARTSTTSTRKSDGTALDGTKYKDW